MVEKFWMLTTEQQFTSPTCNWTRYSPASNCEYLQQLLTFMKNDGLSGNMIT